MQKWLVEEHNSLQALVYCEETQCSAISATRNWAFTRWSSAKQYSVVVALVNSVCWESYHCFVRDGCVLQSWPWGGFFSARLAVWRILAVCRWECVWKVCMIWNRLATCLGWMFLCCWDGHEQAENNRLFEPHFWRRNVLRYSWYSSNCNIIVWARRRLFFSGDQQAFPN